MIDKGGLSEQLKIINEKRKDKSDWLYNARPRELGKSRRGKIVREALLNQGYVVIVVEKHGMKKHSRKNGKTVIEEIKND